VVRLTLEGVSKFYGETKAVYNFSLTVEDEEFLSILGPSGCGKTSLLRLIAGLETLSEGHVLFDDRVVDDVPPKDRNVAMVFQSYALFPHLTVADNIGFPLAVRKTPKDEIDKRVKEVAKLLKISHLLGRKPRELSGGEQQRVALGRAIVRKPDALLMDEPLSNVDAKTRAYLRAELKMLQKEIRTTLIYVTHDQTEAMTMSDRIAVMKDGRLLQIGTPEDIYEHPQDIWTASFIGSLPMNFFECKILDRRGVRAIGGACFGPQSPENIMKMLEGLGDSTQFRLGVRPEDIEIRKTRTSGITCEADVRLLEPMGDSLIVTLGVEDEVMRSRVNPGFRINVGEHVYLTFDWERAHLFLSSTGLKPDYSESLASS
jgi:multiple sugar transport system ATP-binding protein